MLNIQEKFGKRLRELRGNKGLSQEKLSKQAGFDRTYVGKIERGEKNPTLKTIDKLASSLEIQIKEFFEF